MRSTVRAGHTTNRDRTTTITGTDVHHHFVQRWNGALEHHLHGGHWPSLERANSLPFPSKLSQPSGTALCDEGLTQDSDSVSQSKTVGDRRQCRCAGAALGTTAQQRRVQRLNSHRASARLLWTNARHMRGRTEHLRAIQARYSRHPPIHALPHSSRACELTVCARRSRRQQHLLRLEEPSTSRTSTWPTLSCLISSSRRSSEGIVSRPSTMP
jgi:hypothetical protein